MTQTLEFHIRRNRDAWGAIRGFVYQVQHTIQRWLELPKGCALEPEHGEDLDVVVDALVPGADTERVLEQIRYRERDVTLNSSSVRAALAGFYEHGNANPSLELRFRFMTNAHAARERPSLFPARTPGIVAWNSLSSGEAQTASGDPVLVSAIRATLIETPQPEDYPSDGWAAFQGFIRHSDAATFVAFIRRIEIKCGEPEPPDLTDQIRATLVTSGRCATQNEAQVAYERLFCFVFNLLAQRGPRRLAANDLDAALRDGLSIAEQLLISQVKSILDLTATLQPRIEGLEAQLASAAVQMQLLGSEIRLAGALDVVTEAPPQPHLLASRRGAVGELEALLAAHKFVAMYGVPGSGKTQLARLVATGTSVRAWLGLTGFDAARAAAYIGLVRSRLTRTPEASVKGELIVVDDVPAFSPGSTLAAALTSLHRRAGCSVLCVSEHRLLQSLGREMFASPPAEYECPHLSDEDIVQLLQAAGAPPHVIEPRLVAFFAGVTHRNALLFVALAAHLERLQWSVEEEAVSALIAGEFTRGLAPSVSERLFRSVPDDRSRELLHRMRLASGPVSEDELVQLSAVRAAISEPLLRIAALEGIWLQRDASRALSISPLMRALPSATLAEDTEQGCHAILADALLRPQGISPLDTQRALFHLQRAMRWRQYDRLILASLSSAISNREMPGAQYLLDALSNYRLSDLAASDQRLAVCALQFAGVQGRGPRATLLLEQLMQLVASRALPDVHVASAAGLAVQYTEGLKQLDLVRLMIHAVGDSELDAEFPWRQMLIYVGMGLDSDDEARAWLRTFVELPAAQREKLLDEEPLLASIIVNICTEVHVRAGHMDANSIWPVLSTLDELRTLGRTSGVPLLECAAAGVMIVVLREVAKEHDVAALIASSALSITAQDHRGRFLVYSGIGFGAKVSDQMDAAVAAYEEAFDGSFDGIEYDALWAAMLAAEASKGQPGRAAWFLEHGVVASRREDVCTPLLRSKVLLELGLARWLAGDHTWSRPWLDGVELLLDKREDSKEWRSVVTRLSHSIGYITAFVLHGKELKTTADGSEYVKPWIGAFRATDQGAAAIYTLERELAAVANAAVLAHHVGDGARAVRLSRHCIGLNYDRTAAVSAAGLSNIFALLLADDLVEDVVAAATEIGHSAGPRPSDAVVDAHWRPADRSLALFGFLPLILRVAQRLTEDRPAGLVLLDRVSNALRRFDEDPRSGKPWSAVVEAIRACANGGQQLQAESTAIKKVTGWASSVIHHGCLMLMSTHPRATATDAAGFQALTVPTIWNLLERDEMSRQLLLTELLQRYWHDALENDPYRFTSPIETGTRLAQADAIASTKRRLATILETVWTSLRMAIPDETRAWLIAMKQG